MLCFVRSSSLLLRLFFVRLRTIFPVLWVSHRYSGYLISSTNYCAAPPALPPAFNPPPALPETPVPPVVPAPVPPVPAAGGTVTLLLILGPGAAGDAWRQRYAPPMMSAAS